MATDESPDSGTVDKFDRPMQVDTTPGDGDRASELDSPNISDPASRVRKERVPASEAIRDAEHEDRRRARKKIIPPVLIGAATQVVLADVLFAVYGFSNHWHVGATVITAWLSATVVQVIGVVLIVMRFLFPQGDPD